MKTVLNYEDVRKVIATLMEILGLELDKAQIGLVYYIADEYYDVGWSWDFKVYDKTKYLYVVLPKNLEEFTPEVYKQKFNELQLKIKQYRIDKKLKVIENEFK